MEATAILLVVSVIVVAIHTNLGSQLSREFDDWFRHFDSELRDIYHNAATFAWRSSVDSDEHVERDLKAFTANKSTWNNRKCEEIGELIALTQRNSSAANLTILNACDKLLCSGPEYTEREAAQLTGYLRAMQTTLAGTQICVPKHLDVCRNLDHIWEFTYVLRNNNGIASLDLSMVKPKFETKSTLRLYEASALGEFSSKIEDAISVHWNRDIEHLLRSDDMICLGGEEELSSMLMGNFAAFNRSDCDLPAEEVFRWGWESWRAAVGGDIGRIYPHAIDVMNVGARANGLHDTGEVWRQEVDLPDLDATLSSLMQQTRAFYESLHAVLRTAVEHTARQDGRFAANSTIPAHLLGMWSQDWQMYLDRIVLFDEFSLDAAMQQLNWSGVNMAEHADDFYRSLGLPPMTADFWANSIFARDDGFRNCHGTAANMFDGNDYRMIVCAEPTLHDLSVIVHEMGHLHYFMAFKDQPVIYQDGNAALQESIGDAVFLGMMTPHHLNRLNILPDRHFMTNVPAKHECASCQTSSRATVPHNYPAPIPESLRSRRTRAHPPYKPRTQPHINDFDLVLLLRMALAKIPSIPFQYIMDAVRWNLFNGTVAMHDANTFYWRMAVREQGIHPPDWIDRRRYFDLGAKFHTADNTPFVRYFLASFIQAQIFEGLCKVTVHGTVDTELPLPMPLHRCDIYGSKKVGKLLQKALRLGTSTHWTDVLHILTGSRVISAQPLLSYYKPLIEWLDHSIDEFDIPTGW